MRLSPSQIAQYAASAGFTGNDLATAVAIAIAESGGDSSVIGDKALAPTNGPSYGLWQINIGSKANPQYAGVNLLDPQTNANAAHDIYSRFGFNHWTTYGDGEYGMYLPPESPAAPAAAPLVLDASTGLPVTDYLPSMPAPMAMIDPTAISTQGLSFGTVLLWSALGVFALWLFEEAT